MKPEIQHPNREKREPKKYPSTDIVGMDLVSNEDGTWMKLDKIPSKSSIGQIFNAIISFSGTSVYRKTIVFVRPSATFTIAFTQNQ